MTGQEFLESKDIWHHPLVSDRMNVNIYEVSDLLDEFLALQTKPNSINTVLCGEGFKENETIPRKESELANAKFYIPQSTPNEPLGNEAHGKGVSDGHECKHEYAIYHVGWICKVCSKAL